MKKEVDEMELLINKLNELRSRSEKYEDEISSISRFRENEFRPAFFNYSFNIFTRNIESTNMYKLMNELHQKSDGKIGGDPEQISKRIASMLQWSFINILSSFEYAAKCLIISDNRFNEHGGKNKNRIYLRDVMKRSSANGIISDEDLERWCAMIELRNSIIHNNSISEVNMSVKFPNSKIVLIVGERFENIPNDTLNIYLWMLDNIRIWMINIIKFRENNAEEEEYS